MKPLFIASIVLLFALNQSLIFGRPQIRFIKRPQSVYQRNNRLQNLRPKKAQVFTLPNIKRQTWNRALQNDGSENSNTGTVDANQSTTVDIDSSSGIINPIGTQSYESDSNTSEQLISNQPTVSDLINQLTDLVNSTESGQPVTIDNATALIIISYLQEINSNQGNNLSLTSDANYNAEMNNLISNDNRNEIEIEKYENQKSDYSANGDDVGIANVEQSEFAVQQDQNSIELQAAQLQDQHIRDQIQQQQNELTTLHSQGGSDDDISQVISEIASLQAELAQVDLQIKSLTIDQINYSILQLQNQKASLQTSNASADTSNIDAQIEKLHNEIQEVIADTQIDLQLSQTIQSDEQQIITVNSEVNTTAQTVALLRAIRKLKRVARMITDEETEENIDAQNGSTDTSETDTVTSQDNVETNIPPTQCSTISDIQDNVDYINNELNHLFAISNTSNTLSDVQQDFNNKLSANSNNLNSSITCVTNFIATNTPVDVGTLSNGAYNDPSDQTYIDVQQLYTSALSSDTTDLLQVTIQGNLLVLIQDVTQPTIFQQDSSGNITLNPDIQTAIDNLDIVDNNLTKANQLINSSSNTESSADPQDFSSNSDSSFDSRSRLIRQNKRYLGGYRVAVGKFARNKVIRRTRIAPARVNNRLGFRIFNHI